jgi:hypothetical protein
MAEVQDVVASVERGHSTVQHDANASPPRGEDVAPLKPVQSLDGSIQVDVSRTGIPITLPVLGQPSSPEEPCGWTFDLPRYRSISDLSLRKAGLGRASPLVLMEDGRPLAAHASNDNHLKRCAGAFRHAGSVLQFSPKGNSEAALSRAYRLVHDERVPLPRGDDGRELYWVYPGTHLQFTFTGAWPEEADPPVGVIVMKVTGESTSRPSVQAHWDAPQILEGDTPTLRFPVHPLDLMDGWTLHIYSPLEGPYIVVDTLVLGNPGHALVVTNEPKEP